nr:MAG TPA: hypothetical protein [Caudoviricetes sp.]
MSVLWQPLPQQISFGGRRYRMRLAFDNVLAALALLEDPDVTDRNRVDWTLQLLVPGARRLPAADKQKLLEEILRRFVFFSRRKSRGGQPKAMDFEFDDDLIYASFLQAYGIDLLQRRGRMQWWEFYSLLQGLPEKTKLREVMSIRQRSVPPYNGHNQEELRRLLELKQYYAIPGSAGTDDYQTGLQKLWNTLERQAKQNA